MEGSAVSRPGKQLQKAKAIEGFARLFRPRYAGANLGHPSISSISVHLDLQLWLDKVMLICSLMGEVLE